MKPIGELCQPDSRNENLVLVDPNDPETLLPWTLERCYQAAATVSLDSQVPSQVHSYLNTAKMVTLYGWFYYPLSTSAILLGTIACEMGLALALGKSKARLPRLRELILDGRLVIDEDFPHLKDEAEEDLEIWRATKEIPGLAAVAPPPARTVARLVDELLWWRQQLAHPRHGLLVTPGQSRYVLWVVAELVSRVWRRSSEARPRVESALSLQGVKSLATICQPDERSRSPERLWQAIANLQLHEAVPESVRGHHDALRTLYLYGHFHYPLFSVIPVLATTVGELALKQRVPAVGESVLFDTRTLTKLLREAMRLGFLKEGALPSLQARRVRFLDDRAAYAKAIGVPLAPSKRFTTRQFIKQYPEYRNYLMHTREFGLGGESTAWTLVRDTTELINALWDGNAK